MVKDSLLTFLTFLLTWTLLQWLLLKGPDSFRLIAELLWVIAFYGVAGIYLPQKVRKKYAFKYGLGHQRPFHVGIGLILLFALLGFGIFGSGAFLEIVKAKISISGYIKYILIFVPMSFAISLHLFHIIPNTILLKTRSKRLGTVILLIVSGLASGLCFAGDTLLGDIAVITIMIIFGVLFMGVFILTGSFLITWIGYFLVMYFNTLAEGRYFDYEWYVLILGFLFSLSMLLLGSRNTMKQIYNNGLHSENHSAGAA